MSEPNFKVGDLVSRDGSDVQRIIKTNATPDSAPDLITVICIVAPRTGWCDVGDVEDNLASRYNYVE